MGRYGPLIPLSHHINKCEQNYKKNKMCPYKRKNILWDLYNMSTSY